LLNADSAQGDAQHDTKRHHAKHSSASSKANAIAMAVGGHSAFGACTGVGGIAFDGYR
jgi:hypothetical protein